MTEKSTNTLLWGEEFNLDKALEEENNILNKIKNKKKIVSAEKLINSKNLSLSDKLSLITSEVNRILGVYKENTQVITTIEDFDNFISIAIKNGVIAIDTETNNTLDTLHCKLMGLCLYTPGQKNTYIPINHTDLNGVRLINQLTEKDVYNQLARLKGVTKNIFHNAKFDYKVLYSTCGCDLDIFWDTVIGGKVLDENEQASLKAQYIEKIDPSIEKYSIDHLFKIPYNYVDPNIFALYAATDSFMTYQLYLYQLEELQLSENKDVYNLFKTIEMPIIKVVARMEIQGIRVDVDYARKLSAKYTLLQNKAQEIVDNELSKIEVEIAAWRNTPEANEHEIKNGITQKSKSEKLSNPPELGSPTQMAIILYDVLKAPVIDQSSPRGTGAEILEILQNKIPLCKAIVEKRGIDILLNTFINKMPEIMDKNTLKVHGNFNTYGARTGRISSSDPNLQNIPSHAKDIRGIFKANSDTREESFENELIVKVYDELESANGWVSVKNLNVGDSIKSDNGLITISSIEKKDNFIVFKFNQENL